MLINYNVYVWTRRATYNAATKGTTAPTAYLSQVPGQIRLPTAKDLQFVAASVSGSVDWLLDVDVDIDIVEGDTLQTVTELDGVTTYPRNMAGSTRYTWKIRYVDATPPMFLPRRRVYLAMLRDGR